MTSIIGIVLVMVMVFGGYILAGGKLSVILKALPYEMMMIGGAAAGAFSISNAKSGLIHSLKSLKLVFTGPKWSKQDYCSLMCLLFELLRLARQNPIALEEHIELPQESEIFSRYPKIQSDHYAVELIADTLRSASMNYDDPHQVEEVLEGRLTKIRQHFEHAPHSIQMLADGLPALGIVAAVLGVIKTMASIDQPPEILGKMIGGALVGTFLGVFLAYGFVGPAASKIKAAMDDDLNFYEVICKVLIANLFRHSTNICIEVGRQAAPDHSRPSYAELESELKATKSL